MFTQNCTTLIHIEKALFPGASQEALLTFLGSGAAWDVFVGLADDGIEDPQEALEWLRESRLLGWIAIGEAQGIKFTGYGDTMDAAVSAVNHDYEAYLQRNDRQLIDPATVTDKESLSRWLGSLNVRLLKFKLDDDNNICITVAYFLNFQFTNQIAVKDDRLSSIRHFKETSFSDLTNNIGKWLGATKASLECLP